MSRDLLVPETPSPRGHDKSYARGEESHAGLLCALIDDFRLPATPVNIGTDPYEIPVKLAQALSDETLDRHAFLDSIVDRMSRQAPEVARLADYLVSPVIQIFHNCGEERFAVDYAAFDEIYNVARGLQGSEERPIQVSYRLPEHVTAAVGNDVSHAHIQTRGPIDNLGNRAHRSTFIADRPPLALSKEYGDAANESTFYIAGIRSSKAQAIYEKDVTHNVFLQFDKVGAVIEIGHYFGKGNNKVYVHEDGTWQEVDIPK